MLLTPFVLAPFIVSRMTGDTLAIVLGARVTQYIWAVAVVISPIFVIGGVSFAQPGLVRIDQQSAEVVDEPEKVAVNVSETSSRKPATYGKWKTWRKVPDSERRKIAEMKMHEVMATYGVEERTAYNWIKDAKAFVPAEGRE